MRYLFLTLLIAAGLGYFYPGPALAATPAGQVEREPSPDGRWVAVIDRTAGSLALENAEGGSLAVFPQGSTVFEVKWRPDSRQLLVVRTNWIMPQSSDEGVGSSGPIEIWQVNLAGDLAGPPELLYQSGTPAEDGPQQIVFGRWAPDGRHIVFWEGMQSASILADGLPLSVLDTTTGEVTPLGEVSLINPNYYSWAPDSSALAVTSGGYRSAQVNKWLNLLDINAGRVTTVISQTEQIPGEVAWSPQGDLIAYAAVPAADTGPEWADLMTFDNPAIAGRRIYLLDPVTGQSRRLNRANSYQDAPAWTTDQKLCYVQQAGDTVELMVADPATGQAEAVPGAGLPLPEMVGYYGQSDWSALLENCPDRAAEQAPDAQLSLAELRNATYPLEYPADGTAELAGGVYREPAAPNSALEISVQFGEPVAFGDLDGDGLEDAAVVLVSNTGGSGVFFDLFAVLNRNGRPVPAASTLLGDRIELQALAIENGAILVDMISQGPDDPLCCPTQDVTRRYSLLYSLAETDEAGE